MSEKYYREINGNKDIVKFKLQLGAISLKLIERDLNIKNNYNYNLQNQVNGGQIVHFSVSNSLIVASRCG